MRKSRSSVVNVIGLNKSVKEAFKKFSAKYGGETFDGPRWRAKARGKVKR